jgi:hypothetical protein
VAATLSGKDRRHALSVEAGDQHRDRIAGSPTGLVSGSRIAVLGSHRQQSFRARYVAGGHGVRTTDLLQLGSLFWGEFAQAAFLTTRHGGFLRHQSTKSTDEMAMGKPNAPLVVCQPCFDDEDCSLYGSNSSGFIRHCNADVLTDVPDQDLTKIAVTNWF